MPHLDMFKVNDEINTLGCRTKMLKKYSTKMLNRFPLIDTIISVIFKAISLAPSLVKFWDAIQLSGSEPQQHGKTRPVCVVPDILSI